MPLPRAEQLRSMRPSSSTWGSHNPLPDSSRVGVGGLHRNAPTAWVPATIVELTAVDEGAVEFDDGDRAWRDHHELRPFSPAYVSSLLTDAEQEPLSMPPCRRSCLTTAAATRSAETS